MGKPRTITSMNSCLFHRMWIEAAKARWAEENQKTPTDTPTDSELLHYLGQVTPMWDGRAKLEDPPAQLPTCFLTRGNYITGTVGTRVQCSHDAHAWDEQAYRYHYDLVIMESAKRVNTRPATIQGRRCRFPYRG